MEAGVSAWSATGYVNQGLRQSSTPEAEGFSSKRHVL